jgi:hypothetical protein
METNNTTEQQPQIEPQQVAMHALFARFMRYAEANILNAKAADETLSLDQFKQIEKDKTEQTEMERYLDAVAINACSGILDIIVTKVRIVTGEDISEADSDVVFEQTYTCFRDAVAHAENVYNGENNSLYEMPLFTIIDVVSSVAAQNVVERYFVNDPGAAEDAEEQESEETSEEA